MTRMNRAIRRNILRRSKAQSIMEYSIVIGLVFSLFLVMQTYLKRGIQAGIRISAEQLGDQEKGTPIVDPYTGVVEEEMPVGTTEKSSTDRRIASLGGRTVKQSQETGRTLETSYWENRADCKYYDPRDWTLHTDTSCSNGKED